MSIIQKIELAYCPICGCEKRYKTIQGYNRHKNSPCKSCSNSIKNGGSGNVAPVSGNKKCAHCNEIKVLSDFYKYKNKDKIRYHSICDNCKKEVFKKYQKNTGRFKKHGITKEIYDKMMELQSGKCFICENDYDVLYIDHNHDTSIIRKLLCRDCNSALGLIKENKKTINNMKKYIEEHE